MIVMCICNNYERDFFFFFFRLFMACIIYFISFRRLEFLKYFSKLIKVWYNRFDVWKIHSRLNNKKSVVNLFIFTALFIRHC